MMANVARVNVGRLVEIRAVSGYRCEDDVRRIFAAIAAATAGIGQARRVVLAVDWRRCPIMSDDAAQMILESIRRTNSRVLRSAALGSPESPSAMLQFLRLVRESDNPDRRMFDDPALMVAWLDEVLDDQERARLRAFLAEVPD